MNKATLRIGKILSALTASMLLGTNAAHAVTTASTQEENPATHKAQSDGSQATHKKQQTIHTDQQKEIKHDSMTIRDCIQYALDNSLKLKSQKTLTEDEKDNRIQAILQAFTPGISAGTHAYSNFGRSVDPETNTYVSTASFNNGYAISGEMTLFNGFEAVNNIRTARTSVKMGKEREQQLADEICLATIEAYCNVVYYGNMSKIIESQARTAEQSLQLVTRQEELGQKGHADVIEMQAALADMEYKLVNITNLHQDALLTLKNLMSWPLDQPLDICMEIAGQEKAGMIAEREENPAEFSSMAASRNPAVAIARGTMEKARFELKKAKWRFAPKISLSAGWSTSYYTYPGQANYVPQPYMTQLRTNGGEYIQLSLSIPIYNRLGNIYNLKQKKNQCLRSGMEYEQTLRNIEDEVTRAVQDKDGAIAAFLQAERLSDVQEEAYNLNIKKLEQGLISPLEFQKASDNWLNANAERLNALLQFIIKRSVVRYYSGIAYQDQDWEY